MSTQAKIVILRSDYGRPTPFGTFAPFIDTVVGGVYDVLILEPGEVDDDGDEVDKRSVSFRDEVGDLVGAHIDYHEGQSFKFVE